MNARHNQPTATRLRLLESDTDALASELAFQTERIDKLARQNAALRDWLAESLRLHFHDDSAERIERVRAFAAELNHDEILFE